MTDRERLIGRLVPGDVFHANSPNGASLICLAMSVTDSIIEARTVTTQMHLEFVRRTGIAIWETDVKCTIDSVAPLPVDVHQVILGIDRKFRLERNLERLKLSDAEKKALIFIDSHYSKNNI